MKDLAIIIFILALVPVKTFSAPMHRHYRTGTTAKDKEPINKDIDQEKTTMKYSENSKYWAKKIIIDNSYSDGPCSGSLELGEGTTTYWRREQSDLGQWCFYLDNVSDNGDVVLQAGGAFSPVQILAIDKSGEEKYRYDADDQDWEASLEYSKSGNVLMVYKKNRSTHESNWEFVNLLSGETWEKPESYFSAKGLFGHPQIAKDGKVFVLGDYKGEYTGVYDSDGVKLWDKTNCRLKFMYSGNILMSAPPSFDVLKREDGKTIKHWTIKSQPVMRNGEQISFDDETIAFTSDFKYYAAASVFEHKKDKKWERFIGLFTLDGKPVGFKRLEKVTVYLSVRISEDDKQIIVTDTATMTHPEESIRIEEMLDPKYKP